MEYLTAREVVTNSTSEHFLYVYRNSNDPALQYLLIAGYFSYIVMVNIFSSTVCQ